MQYSKRELTYWYNFGHLPKRNLATYISDDNSKLNVFEVIKDSLNRDPELLDSLKDFIAGINRKNYE